MTHAEWLETDDTQAMLDRVKGRASDRKLRLFAVACCRQAWGLLTDARSRAAVKTAERFADGAAGIEELKSAWNAAWYAARSYGPRPAWEAACVAARAATIQAWYAASDASGEYANESHGPILRAIVGDPFTSVVFEPSWRTLTVRALAHAAYDERLDDGRLDPDRLAVLADALEEAGVPSLATRQGCPDCGDAGFWRMGVMFEHMKKCRNSDCGRVWEPDDDPPPGGPAVLAALRSPGPHYRGLWPLDLVLGKE